ncbi:MAG TPA: cupin domain-containing protein [Candidatus Udaeobacter sp.]|jgi:quercetin dioxygenase-like cupin family protein|nr:cupin domain-containing protein [Candidatus Udaeobacter sp.]
MSHFVNLYEKLRAMETDPSTASDPIKRTFLCDGQYLTANLGIIRESGNALHTQPAHDEVVVILEGEAEFRVGDEMRRVGPGDLVFIPRNTLHGPILREGARFSALSVYAPFFNRSKKNIEWERDKQR